MRHCTRIIWPRGLQIPIYDDILSGITQALTHAVSRYFWAINAIQFDKVAPCPLYPFLSVSCNNVQSLYINSHSSGCNRGCLFHFSSRHSLLLLSRWLRPALQEIGSQGRKVQRINWNLRMFRLITSEVCWVPAAWRINHYTIYLVPKKTTVPFTHLAYAADASFWILFVSWMVAKNDVYATS